MTRMSARLQRLYIEHAQKKLGKENESEEQTSAKAL